MLRGCGERVVLPDRPTSDTLATESAAPRLPQLHVVPEPTMVHIWGGVYVPPDESAELQEVRRCEWGMVGVQDEIGPVPGTCACPLSGPEDK